MKNRFFVLTIAALAFVYQSCEDFFQGIPVSFDITETITVQPFTAGSHVIEESVELDAETHVQSVGAELSDVKSIKANTVSVKMVDPSLNFSAFDRVHLTLSADNLPEVVMASKDLNGEEVSTMHFDVADVELADYLKLDEVTVRFEVDTNADIVDPFDIELKVNATIQVNLSE